MELIEIKEKLEDINSNLQSNVATLDRCQRDKMASDSLMLKAITSIQLSVLELASISRTIFENLPIESLEKMRKDRAREILFGGDRK